ncbi:unnamed protein product [Oikopleura dioica]|uniref:Uncharacterized protein n=1 Tax=Oikopleura dioica TaxID=34765 RepID=E4XJL1_OIKDI|nr:unnamed protein product [Oikopleura dioica]
MRLNIFAIFTIKAILASLTKTACPDQDLGDKCVKAIEDDLNKCIEACDSQLCLADCSREYSANIRDCPCSDEHQDGCGSSSHSICTCKNPQVDNIFFRQCFAEATGRSNECYENCGMNIHCFDGCLASFKEEMKECPCMENCPLGCPCENRDICGPNITAMCQSVDFSYSISASGHNKENRHYTTPARTTSPFLYRAGFSIMNGEVYIFGGSQDSKKIVKIEQCAIDDTGKRLISTFYSYLGSLVTLKENSEKIILCNSYYDKLKCESFDGSTTVAIAETKEQHAYACMSINEQGRATIIAGQETSSVEILETRFFIKIFKILIIIFSGWQNAQSHLAGNIFMHTCAALPNGLVTVGGNVIGTGDLKNVYLFRNGQWSVVGQMQNV